ncbi:MAG: Fic family protein [Agathobacter sp.]|nr:Fic family protein [Agathobacter sp.]MEE1033857.1 Fic family protein [Agathobacter sp.]
MNNMSISMGKRQLVDSIWKSAGIEGLGTTFPNTEKILSNLPVQTKRDEVLFIVNMKRAWYFLFDNIDYPDNISYLRELNKICMEELSFDAGNIRTVPVAIGGTSWAPEIPQETVIINKLEEIAHMKNRLEAALEMFCFIARTQMFLDGNKRVAQLMCNKIMMEDDIGIFSIPYDEIDNFKELLVEYYESNDSDKIKHFFREKCLLMNPKWKPVE